ILSGDFCQLPPVPNRINGVQVPPIFAFDATKWHSCVGPPIMLSKVFRQKDQTFVDILNDMRFGKLSDKAVAEFMKLSRPLLYKDGIGPTQLYPTRNEVERANKTQLDRLPGEIEPYVAIDLPGRDSKDRLVSPEVMKTLLERMVTPPRINLKVNSNSSCCR
ncbi:hypothetical protein FIBSPDRAFT_723029, partial [Athelia psychrophila]